MTRPKGFESALAGRLSVTGLFVAAALIVAASSSGASTDTLRSTLKSSSSVSIPKASCAGPAATGKAVKIGLMWPQGPVVNEPEVGGAATAAAAYANHCLGGIGGRPIKTVDCQIDESSAASAQQCANQLVQDGVAAAVDPVTQNGPALVPIFTKAGIPLIEANGGSAAEDSTKGVYVVSSGSIGVVGAIAKAAAAKGYKKVGILVISGFASQLTGIAGLAFGKAGVGVSIIPVPAGTPEITPQVAAALKGTDATAAFGDDVLCTAYLQAVRSLDPHGAHFLVSPCLDGSVRKVIPASTFNGAIVVNGYYTNGKDPESKLYNAVMGKYAPSTDSSGDAAIGYIAMLGLVRATATLKGALTPATINATLGSSSGVKDPALTGGTFGCAKPPYPLAPLSSVCSAGAAYWTLKGLTPTHVAVVNTSSLF